MMSAISNGSDAPITDLRACLAELGHAVANADVLDSASDADAGAERAYLQLLDSDDLTSFKAGIRAGMKLPQSRLARCRRR